MTSTSIMAVYSQCMSVVARSHRVQSSLLLSINASRREYHPTQRCGQTRRPIQISNPLPRSQYLISRPSPGGVRSRQDLEIKKREQNSKEQQRLEEIQRGRKVERLQYRNWKAGDVYAPHDLSPEEMKKWKRRHSPPTDSFDALGINPIEEYKNFAIMSEYMTETGRIKPRSETGLRPVNQRKIAKAIRRAVGLGLMPSVHRHPEILRAEATAKGTRTVGMNKMLQEQAQARF